MINLLDAIKTLEAEKTAIKTEAQKKCDALDQAIHTLRVTNEACWFCGGKGKILRSRACAEDDRPNPDDPRDWNTCSACRGTGIKHWTDDEGGVHNAANG